MVGLRSSAIQCFVSSCHVCPEELVVHINHTLTLPEEKDLKEATVVEVKTMAGLQGIDEGTIKATKLCLNKFEKVLPYVNLLYEQAEGLRVLTKVIDSFWIAPKPIP